MEKEDWNWIILLRIVAMMKMVFQSGLSQNIKNFVGLFPLSTVKNQASICSNKTCEINKELEPHAKWIINKVSFIENSKIN